MPKTNSDYPSRTGNQTVWRLKTVPGAAQSCQRPCLPCGAGCGRVFRGWRNERSLPKETGTCNFQDPIPRSPFTHMARKKNTSSEHLDFPVCYPKELLKREGDEFKRKVDELKRKVDEKWLKNPTIPGFTDTDIGRDDGCERVLCWGEAEFNAEILKMWKLDAYACPISRAFASHLQPGFYGVLITNLRGSTDFIKKVHRRDPLIQIVITTGSFFSKEAINQIVNSLKGLHVLVLMDVRLFNQKTMTKVVQDVALPRYRLKFIPRDDELHVLTLDNG